MLRLVPKIWSSVPIFVVLFLISVKTSAQNPTGPKGSKACNIVMAPAVKEGNWSMERGYFQPPAHGSHELPLISQLEKGQEVVLILLPDYFPPRSEKDKPKVGRRMFRRAIVYEVTQIMVTVEVDDDHYPTTYQFETDMDDRILPDTDSGVMPSWIELTPPH